MAVLGVDIGSRTIKLVEMEGANITRHQVADSGHNPIQMARQLIGNPGKYDRIVTTGYGRHAARAAFAHDMVTEIMAHATGARFLFPKCRTVIDIGGQDSKVIRLGENGQVADFLMNDKCAAGTGKFLETMERALGLTLNQMAEKAITARSHIRITSMCTVFAESEVISLVHREQPVEGIAKGVIFSVGERIGGMVARIGAVPDVVFTGGVAEIPGMSELLREYTRIKKLLVPDRPQITGALGAALCAQSKMRG
ncbi:3-hydroxyacyl-ACP dehydratase [Clostridiales bacterium PH28_bin88]|nr:3-hydroxyacyl-ACP dehydratase [Clostridiales bacterium PH28_bin88]